MLTNEMISKFYQDVNSLGLKFPVAAIAKETGYSKGNVSGYLKGNQPSENFINAFYKKFSDRLKNVPRDTNTSAKSIETQQATISKNADKDKPKNKLTTTTLHPVFEMQPGNGTHNGKDAVIKDQAHALKTSADASKIDSETISKLTDLVTKLIKK